MKTKGVSVIENYIEKIVLALALVIFLAVFAIQFLSSPTVDLPGTMGTVPIEQAEEAIANAANAKINQLESVSGVDSIPPAADISEELIAAFDRAIDRPVQLARLVPSWPAIGGIDTQIDTGVDPAGTGQYAMPTPVAPGSPIAAVMMGTVDPSVPLLYPAAAALLPEQQPMDKAFVSVQVPWDAAANRARMGATPSDGDLLILPQDWRDSMEIWDIELVRRELGSDGSWGPQTVVPPMPGRPSMRDRLASATPPDIPSLQSEERSLRAGIRQPRMYNLIAGDFWTAPALLKQAEQIERPAEVERLLRRVRGFRSEIATLERRLENLGGGTDGGGGGGGAGGGGRGSIIHQPADIFFDIDAIRPDSIRWPEFPDSARAQVGGGGSGGGGGAPSDDPIERRRQQTQAQLDRVRAQLAEAIDRLAALGYDGDGNPIQDDAGDQVDFAASATLSATASGTGNIVIWAHDLTATPGVTYQYAIRVKLRNPLFGNASSVGEAQRGLAEQAVIAGELSDWSEPVTVPNLSEYFVVNATDSTAGLTLGSGPTATVEAYRYFYGAWRRASLRLNTGDSIRARVDLNRSLPEYILRKAANGTVELVEESALDRAHLDFRRSVYLLDVVAGVEDFVTAYFRGDAGQIVLHEPARDRTSPLLARIRASAEEAAEQEFRPLDLTDSATPGRPGQPDRPDAPGGDSPPMGPGAPPSGPGAPDSPFG